MIPRPSSWKCVQVAMAVVRKHPSTLVVVTYSTEAEHILVYLINYKHVILK